MIAFYITVVALAFFGAAFFIHSKYKKSSPKHLAYWLCFTLLGLNGLWTWLALRTMRQAEDFSWTMPKAIALYFASGILSFGILAFMVLMRRATTRWEMETFQRAQYDARVEATADIFEWFFFDTATIRIQFRDGKRSPLDYYVGRIRLKARYLSAVLGVTAIDRARRTSS